MYDSPSEFVFHTTEPEKLSSIRTQGLIPGGGETDGTVAIIQQAIDSLDVDVTLPIDRGEVSYHHIGFEYVNDVYAQPADDTPLSSSPPGIIVTRFDQIDAPTYIGDMGLASDLLDYQLAGEDHLMYADSPEDALKQYAETLVEVTTVDELSEYSRTDDGRYELLVDGPINPDAFATVIS
jgi:hypothetical protein